MTESSTFEGVLAREWKESFEEIFEGAVDESKPPLKLFQKAYDGAVIATSYAEILLNQALRRYGPDHSRRLPRHRVLPAGNPGLERRSCDQAGRASSHPKPHAQPGAGGDLPSATSCSRSALVADMMRTSTLRGLLSPTLSISFSCNTRKSLACIDQGISLSRPEK